MQTLVVALAFALAAGSAEAGTLTFDSLDYGGFDDPWQEQGFYGDPSAYNRPGAGSIHGPGGPAARDATIARDTLFRPVSIYVTGHGGLNAGPEDWEGPDVAYDNLIFAGFVKNAMVAYDAVALGVEGSGFTYRFGRDFGAIDRLLIATPFDFSDRGDGLGCVDCSAIEYDDLVYSLDVAPVPLPATLLLLAGAVAGMGLLRRRA